MAVDGAEGDVEGCDVVAAVGGGGIGDGADGIAADGGGGVGDGLADVTDECVVAPWVLAVAL